MPGPMRPPDSKTMLTLTRGTPTLCHVGLVQISPVLSAVVSCRRDPRNTRESAVNGARKRGTGQPGNQTQGGMLEHGEHDRGAAR
jgi:hypothetical protein